MRNILYHHLRHVTPPFPWTNQHPSHALLRPPAPHTGHVSADTAEDVVDDHDAAVDEEEEDDEDEVVIEEDQMQATVCISSIFASSLASLGCVLLNCLLRSSSGRRRRRRNWRRRRQAVDLSPWCRHNHHLHNRGRLVWFLALLLKLLSMHPTESVSGLCVIHFQSFLQMRLSSSWLGSPTRAVRTSLSSLWRPPSATHKTSSFIFRMWVWFCNSMLINKWEF